MAAHKSSGTSERLHRTCAIAAIGAREEASALTNRPEYIAELKKLGELKRRLDLEDAWAAGAHAMAPLVAILGGAVAMDQLHSWWMGLLVGIAVLVALSHFVHRKVYQVQDEYDKATGTGRYYTGEQSPAVREHLYGPE